MCVWYPLSKCSRSTALRRIPAVCSRLKPRENFTEGKFPLNWLSATMHRCNDFTNTFSRMPYCRAISKTYWVYFLVCLLWSTLREICHFGYCSKLLLFAIQRALGVRVFKCELCHTGRSNTVTLPAPLLVSVTLDTVLSVMSQHLIDVTQVELMESSCGSCLWDIKPKSFSLVWPVLRSVCLVSLVSGRVEHF